MNLQNNATLEAARRLVDAGIVLETDFVYAWCNKRSGCKKYETPALHLREQIIADVFDFVLPAPSPAEVWRELPSYIEQDGDVFRKTLKAFCELSVATYENLSGKHLQVFSRMNLTDALIDLLIWVRKEKV